MKLPNTEPCAIYRGTDEPSIGGGRTGTVQADESRLVDLFGPPRPVNDVDDKVTKRWVIQTPRGYAELRDYWWNADDEWSIASPMTFGPPTLPAHKVNYRIMLWAKRFLRRAGLAVDPPDFA